MAMKLYIGENIRTLRAELAMTQEQLAGRLGCTAQAVSKWENETTAPDIAMLPLLAQALDVHIDALFEPPNTAYAHRGERLLAAYESDRGNEGSYRAAKTEYEKRLHENNPEDRMSYAYLLEMRGWDYLKRAEEGYALAFALGNEKAFRQSILLLHKQGRDEENLAVCRALLAEHPEHAAAQTAMVMALHIAGQNQAAWEAAQAAIEQFPDDAVLLSYAGHVMESLGDYAQAFALWERAVAADPEVSDPLWSVAGLHGKLGSRAQARAAWQAVIDWLESHGYRSDLALPMQELAKWA